MNTLNNLHLLMNDCSIFENNNVGKRELNICELAGNLAYHAMMLEVHLTPKAGLVDAISNGAHQDMNIDTFVDSCNALRPFMKKFVQTGSSMSSQSAKELLPELRLVGIEAEKAMFDATNGVNTHKGMIFTLGLICGAVGWLHSNEVKFSSEEVRKVIQSCCKDLVTQDLSNLNPEKMTAGEKIYDLYGLSGIRGEAMRGYPTIFQYGLPVYQECIDKGRSEEQAMSRTLLSLMAHNLDTNLINRGGFEGLRFVQDQAKTLFGMRSYSTKERTQYIWNFDNQLITKNLSPGGSADLLAATWLFAQLDICSTQL